MGARIIEKHITLDKNLEGADHKVSLLPDELEMMVSYLNDLTVAMQSSSGARKLTQGEIINRETLAKSLFVKKEIKKGDFIERRSLEVRGPGVGLQPNRLDDIVGTVAKRNFSVGEALFESDITSRKINYDFKFNRPVGIPVRYHDFEALIKHQNLDFVEFHLSYNDLLLDPKDYVQVQKNMDFTVHCPELFANDHLLDLASFDDEYRAASIENVNVVLQKTRELANLFPNAVTPFVVVNAGGWNVEGFISEKDKSKKYELVSDSLSQIDTTNVTLAIQTMPPFPWHFGGQSFHNLFIHADEIIQFCKENKSVGICLDTSHSMMASKYFGWNFYKFIEEISAYNCYMHVADSEGIDGEGVQFGKGDIDFNRLFKILDGSNPKTPFITEVWQGHKNGGEGFWSAFDELDKLLNQTY